MGVLILVCFLFYLFHEQIENKELHCAFAKKTVQIMRYFDRIVSE